MSAPGPAATPDGDACYRALAAHDARFDGRFFTGVTSTGIYCRPVCRVRIPRRENCRFFTLAAQAERAGFRPCLRCRPELAPGTAGTVWSMHDAAAVLAHEAARRLDDPARWLAATRDSAAAPVQRLAARMGVSDRHLRRVFEGAFGVSPLQYLQTRRLLAAKQLLADTDLPVADVALAAGFASLRRFQAAFLAHYGLAPVAVRREQAPSADRSGTGAPTAQARLAYRPPYAVAGMLAFLKRHLVAGVEAMVDTPAGPAFQRALAPRGGAGPSGWLQLRFDEARNQVLLQVSDSLLPVLPTVIRQVRALLDLDADPAAIDALLGGYFPGMAGWRVPGSFDGFELAVRAVLGQQVTVAAACTFANRLAARYGAPLATPHGGLLRLFPTPAALAAADSDTLGGLGIVRQRQGAIQALARAVADGSLVLEPGCPPAPAIAALVALPGIGDWTAHYVAMRALAWPDAFPAGDVALQEAMGVRGRPRPAKAAEEASQVWRPWRSYAVLRAWHALEPLATPRLSAIE
ncbi:helix-turn-helix domain-containing protein [Xylophilus ampelinus]|uniref:DNA-3-methyladenine glycosylase II n=2 Tax=Xylophilus ampelinus TaxID=54067 RepID=A0A318T2D8_9BURK|nr:Ada metal-binding domain-containing protein [Xylophilus ampelinus]MCS4509203.1 helix-turn-helix domain-containing protein [Xylophilus ampelinus]PYE79771.1 DNA-3-methyladenine glycosylase II [Xylophilus ampelinus]